MRTKIVPLEKDYEPPPCRVCGSVRTRELGNYLTACYTLIYCQDCGHKVSAGGETPRESMEKCRKMWETPLSDWQEQGEREEKADA